MRRILNTGPVSHDVLGAGPQPWLAASVAEQATIVTGDGREHDVRIVAYGASRTLLGADGLAKAA